MRSKDIFQCLETTWLSLREKSESEVIKELSELRYKLLEKNLDAHIFSDACDEFSKAFCFHNINILGLSGQIRINILNPSFERCRWGVYQALLPYALLMCTAESEGNPIENTYKLSVLFSDTDEALKYLENFIATNPGCKKILRDACSFELPTANCNLPTWQKLSSKYLSNEVFRKKILPNASMIESFYKSKISPPASRIDIIVECMMQYIDRIFDLQETLTRISNSELPIEVRDKYDYTPLNRAAAEGDSEACLRLIEMGADINTKDDMNMTPLIHAAQSELTEVSLELIKRGADVNAKDEFKHTSLYYATKNNLHELVEALTNAGAIAMIQPRSSKKP